MLEFVGVTVIEVSAGTTVMVRALVTVCTGLLESLTPTVKLKTPTATGVPAMAPLAAFSANPAGKDPPAMDQVYGVMPPLAVNVAA